MFQAKRFGWAFGVVVATASIGAAGVVITQEETNPDGMGGTKTETRTIYLEGTKQKITGFPDGMVQIIDAESGTMTTLQPATKTALQMSMEGMGAMVAAFTSGAELEMKPTGKSRTIAGYSCEEFTASGKIMGGETSVLQCVSKGAPGAAEQAAFGKKLSGRMGTPVPVGQPEGLMLFVETTTNASLDGAAAAGMMPPGMSPEILEQIAAQMKQASKPQVSRTEVKSVRAEAIPATAFEIPADYEKKDMGSFMNPSGNDEG